MVHGLYVHRPHTAYCMPVTMHGCLVSGDLLATSPTSITTSIQLEECLWEAEV